MSLNTLQQKIFASFSFSKADLVVYTDDGKISGIRDYFAPTGDAYTFSQPIDAVKDGEIVYGRFSSLNDFIYVAPTKDVTGDMLFWVKTEKLPFIMLSYYDGACYYGKGVKDQPIVSSAGPSYQELRINGVAVKDTAQNIADLTLGKFALVEFRGLTIPKTPWKFGGYKAADGTDYSWQGLIGHVVLTFSTLNDIEIAELEARMVQEYNALDVLPADHPFKSGVKSYNNTIVGRTPAVKITSWLKPTVAIVDYDNAQPVAKLTNVQPDGSFIYETDSTRELKANVTYELTQETMDVVGGTEDYEFVKQMDGEATVEKNWTDATVDALNSELTQIKTYYASTDTTIADLNSQISTLQSQGKEKDVKIANLNEQVTNTMAEVNALNSVIEGELSDLSVKVQANTDKITALEAEGGIDPTLYYNKTQTDEKLDLKANLTDIYTAENSYNKEQVDALLQSCYDRIYLLENQPAKTTYYFSLPSQILLLSSAHDNYAENFKTNLATDELVVTYGESGKSTITFESQTQMKTHYANGSSQNATFTITRKSTGEVLGSGYLCTSSVNGKATRILWVENVGQVEKTS